MWRRIRIYLFGVILGIIIVWAMFLRNRSKSDFNYWLPQERIAHELKNKPLIISDSLQNILLCYKFNSLNQKKFIEKAKVDLLKSKPRNKPKEYLFHYKWNKTEQLEAIIIFKDSINILKSVKFLNSKIFPCPQ